MPQWTKRGKFTGFVFFLFYKKRMAINYKSEAKLQASIVEYIRTNYPQVLLFSVPNEATYRRRNYFHKLGVLSGVSDLILVFLNGILFIECKSKKGRQSIEQINFQKKIEAMGFKYFIVKDLEELKDIINNEINFINE